jgi:hypothetical protein
MLNNSNEMKPNNLKQTAKRSIAGIVNLIKSLQQKLTMDEVTPSLKYVRITEKFDVVRRSQNRHWILTPDRE